MAFSKKEGNYISNGKNAYINYDTKIDSGKILTRMTYPYRKISFPNYKNFKIQDLYQIWFSFYDPAVRISLLRDILKKNIDLNNYLELDLANEENNYYSFLKNKDFMVFVFTCILIYGSYMGRMGHKSDVL